MLPPILMPLLGIAAATVLVMVCTLLPFLPGGYDRLAVHLSAIAQIVGTAGLLVVPFSALRLAAERSPGLGRWRFAIMSAERSCSKWVDRRLGISSQFLFVCVLLSILRLIQVGGDA